MMKGHSGYYGCHVCQIKGEYFQHRMIFPQTPTAKWKERTQEEIEENAEKVDFF